MKRKVAVAMSGGVDSSVAAALLKQAGFEVVGLTMCLGITKESGHNKPLCCSPQALKDAKMVCEKLGIPHYILDFKQQLKKKVIDGFIDDYLKGRTPNPCIACNRDIKFDLLLKKAKAFGAGFLATGHYAGVFYDKKSKRYFLKKAKDKNKDQSYFLYALKKETLPYIEFPLDNLNKEEVRAKAKALDLSVHSKPGSQEICFIPDKNYGEFLKRNIKNFDKKIKPGEVKDLQGNILGQHKGICFYTIGQRAGLEIAAKQPFYVVRIDSENNTIWAGNKEDTYAKEFIAKDLNFFIDYPQEPFECLARIRYKHPEAEAKVYPCQGSKVKVIFEHPQSSITPGQSVVFYDKELVLGGGVIERAESIEGGRR